MILRYKKWSPYPPQLAALSIFISLEVLKVMLVVSTDASTKRGPQQFTKNNNEINDPEIELLQLKLLNDHSAESNNN